jgi:hypothetical protein
MSTITLNFSLNDPKTTIYKVIINPNSPNFISKTYYTFPLYDDCGFQVGYRITTATCQQVDENLYMNKQENTSNIYNKGSISTCYVYTDNVPFEISPPQGINTSSIVSTTGIYLGKTGSATRKVSKDDINIVIIIKFDN